MGWFDEAVDGWSVCLPERRQPWVAEDQLLAHSISSSATVIRVFGAFNPSALAVLRLITSSNLVGC
jgi:hypothetical protein